MSFSEGAESDSKTRDRMSVRSHKRDDVAQLQRALADLRSAAQAPLPDPVPAASSADEAGAEKAKSDFESLTPVEQSAASLGVSPEAWKPIGFLNERHYETLLKQNALDESLARRIEAYKVVAQNDAAKA